MLLIVVGPSGCGKTTFVNNNAAKILGNDRFKIYPISEMRQQTDKEFLDCVLTHRHLSRNGDIDFDHIIIETCSIKLITSEIRTNADYIVFTKSNDFACFCRRNEIVMNIKEFFEFQDHLDSRRYPWVLFSRAGSKIDILN